RAEQGRVHRAAGGPGPARAGGAQGSAAHQTLARVEGAADSGKESQGGDQAPAGRGRVVAGATHGAEAPCYSFLSAATSPSICDVSWAAEIWTRRRAWPSGTTGYPKPITKTPSSS